MESEIQRLEPGLLFGEIEEQLVSGHKASFTVTGMSMWPWICHGRDRVIVTTCDPSEIRHGDILLVRTDTGHYLLHRVTGLREDSFETTGDGVCVRDGWFPRAFARAKVETIIRRERRIDCDAPGWRFVSSVWALLFPMRRPLLRLLRSCAAWKNRLATGR